MRTETSPSPATKLAVLLFSGSLATVAIVRGSMGCSPQPDSEPVPAAAPAGPAVSPASAAPHVPSVEPAASGVRLADPAASDGSAEVGFANPDQSANPASNIDPLVDDKRTTSANNSDPLINNTGNKATNNKNKPEVRYLGGSKFDPDSFSVGGTLRILKQNGDLPPGLVAPAQQAPPQAANPAPQRDL